MRDYDAVVVGGGPAGVFAAYSLSRLMPDKRHLLVERLDERRFGKYHRMCGEAMSARALSELGAAPAPPVLNSIRTIKEVWPGNTVISTRARGYVIDRVAYLNRLREEFRRRGGDIWNDSVCEITDEGHTLACASGDRIRTGYLIGADGVHSLVRRTLFGTSPKVSLLVRQFVCPRRPEPDTLVFRYDERYGGGYRWEFPCGDLMKIGFPMGTDEVDEDFVEYHTRLISAGGIGPIVRGDVCLVGDAAGQTNPLTFGGMRPAMAAGRMAARAISQDRIEAYESWWRSSRLSSEDFLWAYERLCSMPNGELRRSIAPFSGGYGLLGQMRAGRLLPEYGRLYRAYRLAGSHGW